MGFTRLSEHAFQRAAERTSLQPDVLCEILNNHLAVHLGWDETNPELGYRLFHSRPDDAAFVAVQNRHKGIVLTVMPMSYQMRNIRIYPEQLEEARILANRLPKRPGEVWLKVRARYIDENGQFAAKTVMYLDGTAYGNEPIKLRQSFGFDMNVRMRGMEKGVDPFKIVEASIQRVPMGEPEFFGLALMTQTQRLMLALRQKQRAEDYLIEQMAYEPSQPLSTEENADSEEQSAPSPGRTWVA